MMKTEPASDKADNGASAGNSGGGSNMRSASPHRNAYEAGLAALKKATDHLNGGYDPASKPAPLPRPNGRGRRYGSNVHRIKNMFMQMQSPGDEEEGAKVIGNEQAVKLSLPRASSLNENVDHSALLKLGGTVSERVNRFDTKTDGEGARSSSGLSKLQETRRMFEQRTLQEKQAATNRILLKKERASGFQDSRLDVVARFNGSTEALDRLDDPPIPASAPVPVPAAAAVSGPAEAVSPTVSQLSAVFEKADIQNNLYLPNRRSRPAPGPKPTIPAKSGPARSQMKAPPASQEDLEEVTTGTVSNQAAEVDETDSLPQCNISSAALSEEERFRHSGDQHSNSDDISAEAKPELESQLVLTEDSSTLAGQEPLTAAEQDCCRGDIDAGARLVQADVHASSEGDLVDVSAYSGLGEDDSEGSQLDDDDDDEEEYHPESSCTEIEGLPEEEEPIAANRKIRFSTEPIKVFTTYCNEDYDRRNDDVDPMAASAEYELEKRVEKLDLFPVENSQICDWSGEARGAERSGSADPTNSLLMSSRQVNMPQMRMRR